MGFAGDVPTSLRSYGHSMTAATTVDALRRARHAAKAPVLRPWKRRTR